MTILFYICCLIDTSLILKKEKNKKRKKEKDLQSLLFMYLFCILSEEKYYKANFGPTGVQSLFFFFFF